MSSNEIKQAYLSFKLNNELFAVSAFKVLEVLEIQHITIIPQAPTYIMGIINFRGDVLPVVDTRKKFNMPGRDDKMKYVIIVLDLNINGDAVQLGAVADSVKDVFEIDESDMKDIPKMGCTYNAEYIKGMIHSDNGFTMILDVDKIFSIEDSQLIAQTVVEI